MTSRSLWLALLVLTLASCSSSRVKLDRLDRTKPTAVATATLRAYTAEDITTLQALATTQHQRTLQRQAATPLPTSVAVSPLFRGAIWEAAQRWNGKILEVRFSNDLQRAYALFERDDTAAYVVVLRLERSAWRLDDMLAYTPAAYATLSHVLSQE